GAYRMSYFAACPLPSVTSVNDRVITVSVAAATARSVTVPGAVGTVGAGVRAVPLAKFESGPNTAFTISVPRYDTSAKSYEVAAGRPVAVAKLGRVGVGPLRA